VRYDFYYVKCKFGCDDDRTCKDLNHESLSLSLSLFLNLRLHPLKCMLNDTESFIKSHFIDTLDSLISVGDARRLREIYWRFLINDELSEKFYFNQKFYLTFGLENILLCYEKLITEFANFTKNLSR